MSNQKTVPTFAIGIAVLIIGLFVLANQTSSNIISITAEKTAKSSCTIDYIKKTLEFDPKLPRHLPPDYVIVDCQANPFETQILYHNKNLVSDNVESLIGNYPKYVANGAIYLHVLNEKDFVGIEQFLQDIGNTDEFLTKEYESAKKENPSLNLQLIEINGRKALSTNACDNCGTQKAVFDNGNEILSLSPVPSKVKFYDDGIKYFFQSNMPLSSLIEVARSVF